MKKRSIHFIKIFSAIILFCAPCALCLFLLREQLPENVLLYSYSRALWLITPVAGISAAVALKGRDAPDEDVIDDDGEYDSFSDTPEDLAGGEKFIEEYSELYRNCDNDNKPVRSVPDIATAISAQKSVICDESSADHDEDERDRIWNEFISDKSEDNTDVSSIYDNIPDTLPEGFSFTEDEDDDENEDSPESDVDGVCPRRPFPAVRAAAAVICAASVIFGAALSRVYVADTADGISVGKLFGKESYSWSDTEKIEISPGSLGDDLRVLAYMNDGKKYTLCSGLMLRGDGAAAHFGMSNAQVYAYICRRASEGGAELSVRDKKTIQSTFENSEEWEYVSEMIGEAE